MIGVFDSGVGGLTAVKALDTLRPDCDIIYFGDTARVPYGTRSKDVIGRYALQDCRFLISKHVDAILVACGTVSSNSLPLLCEAFDIPVVGVVNSASARACEAASTGNGVVAVLGTPATVKSGAYERAIRESAPGIRCISRACPLLVPLAENGRYGENDTIAVTAVREYIEDIIPQKPDAVILGCTHYPLFSQIFRHFLPDSVLINTAYESAKDLLSLMDKKHIDTGASGSRSFFVSDDPASFAEVGIPFLGRDISNEIQRADITTY